MTNYKKIIDDFAKIAEKHKQINSFGSGDLRQLIYLTSEVDKEENTKDNAPIYPLLYVVPISVSRGEQQKTLSFSVVVADIMNATNYDIETDLFSDTLQIAEDIIAQFKYSVTPQQGDYQDLYELSLPTNLQPFSESFDDILVGWTISLDIVLSDPLNRCIAPYNNFH